MVGTLRISKLFSDVLRDFMENVPHRIALQFTFGSRPSRAELLLPGPGSIIIATSLSGEFDYAGGYPSATVGLSYGIDSSPRFQGD